MQRDHFKSPLIIIVFILWIGLGCELPAILSSSPNPTPTEVRPNILTPGVSPSPFPSPLTPTITRTPAFTMTPVRVTLTPPYFVNTKQYDIGLPTIVELYVSLTGKDTNNGFTRFAPLRTIGEAWRRIPTGVLSYTGYRINLMPGTYPCEGDCANYFAERTGTHRNPIIIQAADGPGTVILMGGLNLHKVGYLYLIDLTLWAGNEAKISWGNNVLHIEQSDHVLMRNLKLYGPEKCLDDVCNDIQEILKVNQSQHVYLENSELSGAYQTVLDYFAVQYGHIINSHIHHSGGRCAYLKGGSAYFVVSNNRFDDCREAGFQAGEGSNLAFMRPPWIQYEAYDIKVVNNLIHDIYGAGLSVQGGTNILMAYNTLYRIGMSDGSGRDWALIQLIHGNRSCIEAEEFGGKNGTRMRCEELLKQGGWGTSELGDDKGGEWIPNRNVFIYNNLLYNPRNVSTRNMHFLVNGPINPPAHSRNIPKPSRTDDNVSIRGNLIWNMILEGAMMVGNTNNIPGCTTVTCNLNVLINQNFINRMEPELIAAGSGNFRPVAGGNVFKALTYPIPNFTWDIPSVPPGNLENSVKSDYNNFQRQSSGPPGAFINP